MQLRLKQGGSLSYSSEPFFTLSMKKARRALKLNYKED